MERDYRWCLAALQNASPAAAAGIAPAQVGAVAAHRIRLLRLPTTLFRLVAARMLRIDPRRARAWRTTWRSAARPDRRAVRRVVLPPRPGACARERMAELVTAGRGRPVEPGRAGGAAMKDVTGR
jgi:2-dehydropantoate 2-reductase